MGFSRKFHQMESEASYEKPYFSPTPATIPNQTGAAEVRRLRSLPAPPRPCWPNLRSRVSHFKSGSVTRILALTVHQAPETAMRSISSLNALKKTLTLVGVYRRVGVTAHTDKSSISASCKSILTSSPLRTC